jgi:hypothetical protein
MTITVSALGGTPVTEGGLLPVARLGDATPDGIDGLVFQSASHWFVFWTMDVTDRRAIVGLEVRPKRDSDADETPEWAISGYQELRQDPPPSVPLDATLLRHKVSYREVMRARQGCIGQQFCPEIEGFDPRGLEGQITPEDLRRLDNLMDAIVYDWAVRTRAASPVKAIAERRGVSERTAEGRIARARAMGLLTPATGRRASGGLSEKAHGVIQRLHDLGVVVTRAA